MTLFSPFIELSFVASEGILFRLLVLRTVEAG